MDYSKFYTPNRIADILIEQIEDESPEVIIDICCGSCNLLHAASKRWKNAKLIGVDIKTHSSMNIHCVQCDGREYAVKHKRTYSLVLANPPFDFVNIKKQFPELYYEFNKEFYTSRLEIEMLLANLLILDENGILMIIMPSTFINAESYKKIRCLLAKMFCIQKVIQLPEETFGAAKINSFALIIKKKMPRDSDAEYSAIVTEGNIYSTVCKIVIPYSQLRIGNWTKNEIEKESGSELKLMRGNISSQDFTGDGLPVLHTSKRDDNWKPTVRFISEIKRKPIYAEEGDIIISRIGKSAGKWCIYSGEKTLISDCLYCVKNNSKDILNRLNGKEYSFPLKGVAARYITMEDFNAWYKSLKD